MDHTIKRMVSKLRFRLIIDGDCTDLLIEYAWIIADVCKMEYYAVINWFNELLEERV